MYTALPRPVINGESLLGRPVLDTVYYLLNEKLPHSLDWRNLSGNMNIGASFR